jgi:hypothetical protein
LKKNYAIDNGVFYKCANFQTEIFYILGSEKMTNKDFEVYEQ